MASVRILAVESRRSPEPQHRPSVGANPKKDNVATRIAIGERQSDKLQIELCRLLCVRDRQMGFVKVHFDCAPSRLSSETVWYQSHKKTDTASVLLLDLKLAHHSEISVRGVLA